MRPEAPPASRPRWPRPRCRPREPSSPAEQPSCSSWSRCSPCRTRRACAPGSTSAATSTRSPHRSHISARTSPRCRLQKQRLERPGVHPVAGAQRFGWVIPGETGYRVIGTDGKVLSDGGSQLSDPAKPLRRRRRSGGRTPTPRLSQQEPSPSLRRTARTTAGRSPARTARTGSRPTGDRPARPRRRPRTARPTAPRHRRRRAPLSVRKPRRRVDRAPPLRRHAVPDVLLPDLPAGSLRDRHARGRWSDARDDAAAR